MIHPSLRKRIEPLQERWDSCTSSPESTLLRLSLLRRLYHDLHEERSRLLAEGDKKLAKLFKLYEQRTEELRETSDLNKSLPELFSDESQTALRKKTFLLPEDLLQIVERDKFLRPGRQWEHAITAEALYHGWKIWTLTSWVAVKDAQNWDAALSELLWPNGLVLWAESARIETEETASGPIWQGRWTLLLHPSLQKSETAPIRIQSLRGSLQSPPSSTAWVLLYSPPKHL